MVLQKKVSLLLPHVPIIISVQLCLVYGSYHPIPLSLVGSLLSHTFSSYSSKTKVADIALCRLVDLLKNGKGYTICEDLTGEGMRGDVLTLLRVGVLSPLGVLCEVRTTTTTTIASPICCFVM